MTLKTLSRDLPKSRWSSAMLKSIHSDIHNELTEKIHAQPHQDVLSYSLAQVIGPAGNDRNTADASKFFYAVEAIVLCGSHSAQALPTIKKLEKIAKAILYQNKVRPRKSQLAHLHGFLSRALSFFYKQQGMMMHALWQTAVGFTLAQGGLEPIDELQTLDMAQLLLQRGSASTAAELFLQIADRTKNQDVRQKALIGRIKALRLCNRASESQRILVQLQSENLRESQQKALNWELFAHHALNQNAVEWSSWAKLNPVSDTPIHQSIQYNLWILAEKSVADHQHLLKLSLLKKTLIQQNCKDAQSKQAFKTLESFAVLQDTDIPFETRLEEALQILLGLDKLDVESRLLTLLALLRWLMRNNQKQFALVAAEEYEALCLRLTNGQSREIFSSNSPELRAEHFTGSCLERTLPEASRFKIQLELEQGQFNESSEMNLSEPQLRIGA